MAGCLSQGSSWYIKIKGRLVYFPLSCLHITIIIHTFCAWMLSSLLSSEILIDWHLQIFYLKDIRLASNKGNSLILPFSCFLVYVGFFSILCRHKCNKNLKWAVTAIFILVVMLICNTVVFLWIFCFTKWVRK